MPRKSHPPVNVGTAPRARYTTAEHIASAKRRPHYPTTPWNVEDYFSWVAYFEAEYNVHILGAMDLIHTPDGHELHYVTFVVPAGKALEPGVTLARVSQVVDPKTITVVNVMSACLFRLARDLDRLIDDLSDPR